MNFGSTAKLAWVCTAALAALTISPPAHAETIFLKCGEYSTWTVDLTGSTVDNIPANITPLAIDWETGPAQGGAFVVHFHIDRVAGTQTVEHHGQTFPPVPCTAVSAPPTKF